ncbi:hypothetical protein UFOVP201_10 [uncultured Caudovirales phage]|uniref:Uncharacterized protein n=1 Tax=uncultured Caudovirales phage TaxID=2100421 RepID=A0A6J7WIY9_9CAUD|nr:hypothetical protein UFOVP201_10 [uncultured Caudovirales phage]
MNIQIGPVTTITRNGRTLDAIEAHFHPDMNKHLIACTCCGRKMTEKQNTRYLHMTHFGYFIPADTQLSVEEGSQGFFPIGKECAKLFPPEFIGEICCDKLIA